MKLGSLFDGSGGFPLAGSMCGIEPVWASEVEPYPIAVTRSRFPSMKHLGDVSKINGAEIEPVDIITFGSPCQDLSVAGKRAGLKHEDNGDDETTRSGLFMEAVRIIKEMREATNGRYPTYAVWENVPGAFSSNGGEDFKTVLEELIRIAEPSAVMPDVPKGGWAYADWYMGDGWSIAYRVLDAQYWGVPQRRRRIYLVLDLGGERAGKILFEREGVRGYFETGRTPWQGIVSDVESGIRANDREGESGCIAFHLLQDPIPNDKVYPCMGQGNSDRGQASIGVAYGFDGYNGDLTGTVLATLGVNCRMSTGRNGVIEAAGFKELNSAKARSDGYGYEVAPCLAADKHDASVCYGISAYESNAMKSANPHSGIYEAQTSRTLDLNGGNPACNQGGIAVVQPAVAYAVENHPSRVDIDKRGKVQTLTSRMGTGGGNVPMVMEEMQIYALDRASFNQGQNAKYDFEITDNGINPTLIAKGPSGVCYSINHQGGNVEQVIEGRTGTLTASMNSSENNKLSVAYAIENGQVDQTDLHDIPGALNYMHDQQAVLVGTNTPPHPRYIVRRLTPTECARLQGFPDRWEHPDHKEDLPDEEYEFWCKVNLEYAVMQGIARPDGNGWYEVWREVKPDSANGEDFAPYWENTGKPYTHKKRRAMLAWYNKLHTDSAEYKMWGNGIALPTALYVMQGIAD